MSRLCVDAVSWQLIKKTLTEDNFSQNHIAHLLKVSQYCTLKVSKVKQWNCHSKLENLHRSLQTHEWKEHWTWYITSISWPAQSPDINSIDNIWKVLKSRVQQDISNIKTREDLIAHMLKCLCELHSTYIWQLYESISRRICSVVISKWYTKNYWLNWGESQNL